MQNYKVCVKIGQIEGAPKGVFEEVEYTVLAKSAVDAINSVVVQKKVDIKNIKYAQYEERY